VEQATIPPEPSQEQEGTPREEKRCVVCKEKFEINEKNFPFSRDKQGRRYFYAACRACHNERNKISRRRAAQRRAEAQAIEARLVGTPYKCGACGSTRSNIVGDVDQTYTQLGYLCAHCADIVEQFGHDQARLRHVLDYLQKTRPTQLESTENKRSRKTPKEGKA
jgi:DNA-directed RNA polymerase subunit RPC12/RpoP